MIRMGRSSRTDETPEPQQPTADAYRYETPQPTTQTRAISESDSMARDIKEGRLSGFVGHGTTLTGETEFQAMLRVDGHLIGTVSSSTGTLIVGTNGQVDANVSVAAAMINGTVNGDIVATEKLQLGRTARVMGNIQSPKLIVEEGAILEGSCSMLKARENREKTIAAATPVVEPPPPTVITPVAEDEDDQPDLLAADDDDDETAESATA
ncbi:MAG TPA: polymer-forming cytoskeletal protein [Pyrinomonadaceae bacterium]|nr:polymer-forming cytoskeletal protein [Pyrinomonadaceae bacterium]